MIEIQNVREMSKILARMDREYIADLVASRRERGLTQADVAATMGVKKGWVRKFESYDSDPRMSEVRQYEVAVYAASKEKEQA